MPSDGEDEEVEERLRAAVEHLDDALEELRRANEATDSERISDLIARGGETIAGLKRSVAELAVNADLLEEVDDERDE